MVEASILDPTTPDYRKRFEVGLAQESINIEVQQERDLADRVLVESLYKDGKFNCVRFVDYVLESYPEGTFITPMTQKGGDVVWRYYETSGTFKPDGVPWAEAQLKNILGEDTTTGKYRSVAKHLQVDTYTNPEEFVETQGYVVLLNGVLELETGELLPFSPMFKAKNRLPVRYDPKADCPVTKRFLNKVCPTQLNLLQEWVGFHLLKHYRYQREVVLVGDGDNGKSTFLNQLTAFLGPENVSGQSLYQLSTNRFSPAQLHGKLANIAADIGPNEMKNTSVFKTITGDDWFDAEHKNQDAFKMKSYAKLTFSCNAVPKSPDRSYAFMKRFLCVDFNVTIPPEEQDKNLIDKLTTPEELSGLLNWALIGMRRLEAQGGFSEASIEERTEAYYIKTDPVSGFIPECIEEGVEYEAPRTDLYSTYRRYCKQRGIVSTADRAFYQQLRDELYITDAKITVNGLQVRGFKGIRIKEQYREEKPSDGAGHDTETQQTRLTQ